jgi:hypothetical protein
MDSQKWSLVVGRWSLVASRVTFCPAAEAYRG